jgi:hypothetical protein
MSMWNNQNQQRDSMWFGRNQSSWKVMILYFKERVMSSCRYEEIKQRLEWYSKAHSAKTVKYQQKRQEEWRRYKEASLHMEVADQYMSYYWGKLKWSKKVVLYVISFALFNVPCVYRKQNPTIKIRHKKIVRPWLDTNLFTQQLEWSPRRRKSTIFSTDDQPANQHPTPRGPTKDLSQKVIRRLQET